MSLPLTESLMLDRDDGPSPEMGPAIALPVFAGSDALLGLRDQIVARDEAVVVIDAGGVERIGTNTLLLLLAAEGAARRDGRRMLLRAPSAGFVAAAERLGLWGLFAPLLETGEDTGA